MLFRGGFTFPNFIADVASIFIFVLWLWLMIIIIGDLFRRTDISGFAKLLWVILMIILPYIGVFVYLLTQSRGMAERDQSRRQHVREELRHLVGYSVADELEKLLRLKNSGAITEEEYMRLRAKAIAG
jgi:predicted membrane channel-forming protein YqfA (hemolysin III family)